MSARADHVYTDPASIERLEMLIEQLPGNARVHLLMKGGESIDAVVSVRPSIQTFIDPSHREGMNAEMRLERPDQPGWWKTVWLDQIASVQHHDSTLGGES